MRELTALEIVSAMSLLSLDCEDITEGQFLSLNLYVQSRMSEI